MQMYKGYELKPIGPSPTRYEPGQICYGPDCYKKPISYGLCPAHRLQKKLGIELRPIRMKNKGKTCSFDGCGRPAANVGLCKSHYYQHRRGQELRPIREKDMTGQIRTYLKNGYIEVSVWPEHPWYEYANQTNTSQRRGLEHRLVMAEALGRKLLSTEQVHHKDGNRSNNTLENLQVRQGNHGAGFSVVCADCGSTNVKPVNLG